MMIATNLSKNKYKSFLLIKNIFISTIIYKNSEKTLQFIGIHAIISLVDRYTPLIACSSELLGLPPILALLVFFCVFLRSQGPKKISMNAFNSPRYEYLETRLVNRNASITP